MWNWRYSKKFLLKIMAIVIAFTICFLIILNVFIWNTDVSKLENPVPQPTIIYDQAGSVASKISTSNIEGVSIKQIPSDLTNAVISTEDQRFNDHHGINYVGIARAMVKNLFSGGLVAGGSTITQQLAKNVFLTQERTYTRKFKELIFTKKIERTYSKDKIMERYLNQIYFGEGAWGIQRAAQVYFGKDVNKLTLSESAMLAGLIKAPSILSPFKNYDMAIQRRNIVLSLMKNEGYISQSDLEKAKQQTIVLKGKQTEDYKGKYPHYVDNIIDEAINKYHLTQNEVLSGGLRIYTELNPTMQDAVEEVYKSENMFPKSQPVQLIQSGAIFINPSTGGISALIGGRGEHSFRQFNRATQLKRQPGSIMKPLSVYTPALEQGYDIFDMLQDSPLNIDGYQPQNYDNQFRGSVSMYDAVIHSYNVSAVWLLQKMGLEHGGKAVERFGVTLEQKDYIPGLALGGMNKGTSPLQMAQAFSAFPNNGIMVEAHAIQRIENASGVTLEKWNKKESRVTEPSVAQKITFMLKGVVNEGTGVKAQIEGREIAGKTGTTQLPFSSQNGAKDHWFVGYTPQVVGAIWLGYDKTDQSHYLSSSSSGTATVIFKEILLKSGNEVPPKGFDLSLLGGNYIKQLEKKEKAKEEKRKQEKRKQEKRKQDNENQSGIKVPKSEENKRHEHKKNLKEIKNKNKENKDKKEKKGKNDKENKDKKENHG
ncbi:transglycosylase domain-containing protein [Peribacillus sp. NPDC096540]|uniref:transglycosylase domain-containing protein n=1 Tax=Peribacillus sp. NPDC096540 TaxID=3390612 RepID=UPI003D084192